MTATNQQSTPESDISEPLLWGALNTISKQVKEISNLLPKVASREDLRQLLEATSGNLDSVAGNINNRLYSIDTVTKNVDRKIDGVTRKKDFESAETRLSNKIQQAEDFVRRNIRSDMESGLQTLLTKLQSKISSDAVSATNSVNNSINSAAQKILTAQRNSNAAITQQLGAMEERLKNIGEST